jgi:hypothetical protein
MSSRKSRTRTLLGTDHVPGKFRQQTVVPLERQRLKASIGEHCLARQMMRLEARDRDER